MFTLFAEDKAAKATVANEAVSNMAASMLNHSDLCKTLHFKLSDAASWSHSVCSTSTDTSRFRCVRDLTFAPCFFALWANLGERSRAVFLHKPTH